MDKRRRAENPLSDKRLLSLLHATNRVHAATSKEEVLDLVTEQARAIIGAHQAVASLTVNEQWAQSIHSVALSDKYAAWRDYDEQTDGSGIYALVCRENRSLRMTQEALESHPAWRGFGAARDRHPPMRGWLAAPLTTREGRNLGLIQLSDKFEGEFEESDETILVHFANSAATAIENLLLAEKKHEADEIIRSAFENSAIGIAILDAEGNFLRGNAAFETIVGAARRRFSVADARALVQPDDDEESRLALARLASGESVNFVHKKCHAHDDGSVIWTRCSLSPIRDRRGKVVRLTAVVEDITASKQAQAQARALAERFELTLSGISDAFITLDREWRFTYANSEAERLLGRKRPEFLGKVIWEAFPQCAEMASFKAYHKAMAEKVKVTVTDRYPPQGRWFQATAYPSEEGLAIYFQDITDLQQAHEALRKSEDRFRLVAKATADAVWDWDLQTDEVWWSEGYLSLFGHDPAKIDPGSWSEHLHPEDKERVLKGVYAAIEGTQDYWADTYRFVRADGSFAHVADRGFIIRDEGGAALRMVGGMTDETKSRVLEARLQHAQRLEAVGQLTGGVAHDFNNLLTVILGNGELLAESLSADPRLRTLADMICAAAERGAALTSHLLAFARRQALEPKVIDVGRLVAAMNGLLRRTLGENIEIEVVCGDGLWPALVDAAQLEGAVLNLCLNARDAMPDGGRLTIELANVHLDQNYADWHEEVTPGHYVMIAISDSGGGMPPDVIAHVFEPFFTTKAQGKGSGLGLAMVYGFIKQSRGHVKIYSEAGQGTTVKLYLPRAAGAAAQTDFDIDDDALAGGSEKILLVEDNDLVRAHVAAQLKGLGYRVVSASNGREALAALNETADFDLLFTDVVMPGGINGRQLAKEAKALRPHLKVLFTSGYTENAIVHHGRLDRDVHLLNKPYRRKDLAAKIRLVLRETHET
ncbi:MAG: PAS domain S-box protein [Pseudomonadota bacterium]